jgi:hypothetical protein
MSRHVRWLAGAVIALVSAALAVLAPASWWGVTFALGVVAAMVAARPVVRASYAPGWTRSTVLVGAGAAMAGAAYAFAVEPFGPVPAVPWVLGGLLVLALLATCADAAQSATFTGRGGAWANKMTQHDNRRSYR